MQSLKELRAQNAARRLSGEANDGGASGLIPDGRERAPLVVPSTEEAAATMESTQRAGRTLAPLASKGSLVPSNNPGEFARTAGGLARSAASQEGDAPQEDREARRRRRRRRRPEQHDQDEGKTDGDVRPSSTATRPSNDGEDEDEGNVRQAGGGPRTRGSVSEIKKASPETTLGMQSDADHESARSPLDSRGAPPQEEPRKKLTPLAARRARMEQQKMAEAKRAAATPGAPPNESPPSYSENDVKPGRKGDFDHQSTSGDCAEAEVGEGGTRSSDTIREGLQTSSGESLEDRFSSGKEEGGNEQEESHTENDRLIPAVTAPINNAVGKSEDEGKNGGEVETSGFRGGGGEEEEKEVGTARAGDTDDVDDAVESRFRGMRTRMKKAGQGLMSKNSPTATLRRAKERDRLNSDKSARSRSKELETDAQSSEDTAVNSDGNGRTIEGAGPEADDARVGGSNIRQHGRNLDTASEGTPSPFLSGEDEDRGSLEDQGSDDESDATGQARNLWGRAKALPGAEVGDDKEVTLGHVVDRKMREMGYMRKPAVDDLKNRRSLRNRVAAEGTPEVHFIGELFGAEGFGSGVSCRFRVEGGRHWTCLAGLEEGQTHVVHVDYGEPFAPWNHPIDLHYTTKSIQGWPRLMVQVWQLDVHGRNVLRGYGFRHLPSSAGFSEVSVPCWRPTGTLQEETAAFFLGVTPRLAAEDAVFNRAWDQRCRLVTLSAGTVWVQINGLFRNMQDQGVDSLPFS